MWKTWRHSKEEEEEEEEVVVVVVVVVVVSLGLRVLDKYGISITCS
jgi:hypothetical protein